MAPKKNLALVTPKPSAAPTPAPYSELDAAPATPVAPAARTGFWTRIGDAFGELIGNVLYRGAK